MNKHLLYLLFILLYGSYLSAQTVMPKPSTYLSVVDETGTLTAEEKGALSNKLDAFKAETGHELVVVMINSLNGLSVESYANTLFNNWGIGKKGKDDGVLLLIAIKDRRMRIETGYAAEAVLTDAESARVLDELLTPHFKRKEFYEGLEVATNYLITQLHPDFGFESYALRETENVRGTDLDIKKEPISNEKPFLPTSWLLFFCFAIQLLAGYFVLKKYKYIVLYLSMVTVLFLLGALIAIDEFERQPPTLYLALFSMTALSIGLYLFVYMPVGYTRYLKKFGNYLFMLFMAMILSVIITVFVVIFTENVTILVVVFSFFTLLFFILIATGKLDLESGSSGGSYSSSGYSSSYSDYGGSSYSDSSSSYSDSSYGGGSSGGGGASGSW